jgi:hypothetical protein
MSKAKIVERRLDTSKSKPNRNRENSQVLSAPIDGVREPGQLVQMFIDQAVVPE